MQDHVPEIASNTGGSDGGVIGEAEIFRGSEGTELSEELHVENEVDRIREIWKTVREQHDVTQTPSLVAAFEALISEKSNDGQFVARHHL